MRAPPALSALLLLPMLGGCVMGPDFARPPAPAAMGPRFVRAEPLAPAAAPQLGPWWRALHDPLLDRLIARALASNPSLDAAQARVRQARASAASARAAFAPAVGTGGGAGHVRVPAALAGGDGKASSAYIAGFDALWEIDLFGGRQRGLEAARAELAASEAGADDARLSLSAEVARRYIELCAARRRLDLARRSLAAQQHIVELTLQLEGAGKVSRAEREQAERDLEAARLAVAALQTETDGDRDALAVLCGEAPGALDGLLEAAGDPPLPPATVAIVDPAAMIARRPDVRAAEQQLRAANAQIGVAKAARMPKVTLAGVIGLAGAARGDIASMDNLFELAGPALQWTPIDFGRGRAAVDQAVAGRDEADAAYRAAVLAALQDAEGSLARYGEARKALAIQARATGSARDSAGLADEAYRAGRSSALVTLAAERERLTAEDALVEARAALTIDYVGLQKAMAMGWKDAPYPA
jgi:NodT family efflux transporter outer membrane factor (OMF) lipoprotein